MKKNCLLTLKIVIFVTVLLSSCTLKGVEASLVGKWKITEVTISPNPYDTKFSFDNYIWEIKYDDTYTKKGKISVESTVSGVTTKYTYDIDTAGDILYYSYPNEYNNYYKTLSFNSSNSIKNERMTIELGFNTVTFKHAYKAGGTEYTETIKGEKIY